MATLLSAPLMYLSWSIRRPGVGLAGFVAVIPMLVLFVFLVVLLVAGLVFAARRVIDRP